MLSSGSRAACACSMATQLQQHLASTCGHSVSPPVCMQTVIAQSHAEMHILGAQVAKAGAKR